MLLEILNKCKNIKYLHIDLRHGKKYNNNLFISNEFDLTSIYTIYQYLFNGSNIPKLW